MSSTTLSITLSSIIIQPKFAVVTLSDNLKHTILLGGTLQSGTPNGDAYDIYKSSSGTWAINTYSDRIITSLGEMNDIISHNSVIYYTFSNTTDLRGLIITPTTI